MVEEQNTHFDANISDESLIKRASKGDKPAFEIFYSRHKRHIFNYVYRIIGNHQVAEQLMQDVFVRAYVYLHEYTGRGKPSSWVYGIARNLCKNFLRDTKEEGHLSLNKGLKDSEGFSLQDVLPAGIGSPSELTIRQETEDLVQRHISALPLVYREALVLCDIQGCSYDEAAKILHCSLGTVGSRVNRARLLLAEYLEKYYK